MKYMLSCDSTGTQVNYPKVLQIQRKCPKSIIDTDGLDGVREWYEIRPY
jgi:hypothetical protein